MIDAKKGHFQFDTTEYYYNRFLKILKEYNGLVGADKSLTTIEHHSITDAETAEIGPTFWQTKIRLIDETRREIPNSHAGDVADL